MVVINWALAHDGIIGDRGHCPEANSIHPLCQDYSGTALVGGPDSVVKFKARFGILGRRCVFSGRG